MFCHHRRPRGANMYYPWSLTEAKLSIFNVSFFVKNDLFTRNERTQRRMLSLPDHKLSKCLSRKPLSGSSQAYHTVLIRTAFLDLWNTYQSRNCSTSSLIETGVFNLNVCLTWTVQTDRRDDTGVEFLIIFLFCEITNKSTIKINL